MCVCVARTLGGGGQRSSPQGRAHAACLCCAPPGECFIVQYIAEREIKETTLKLLLTLLLA